MTRYYGKWQLLVALTLIPFVLFTQVACNTSWVGQAEQIVSTLLPSVLNILSLVAVLQNKSITAADVLLVTKYAGQAQTDLQLVDTLLRQYTDANAQTTFAKINAALVDVQQNMSAILTATHITDPATMAKVQAIVGVVVAEVQSLRSLVVAAQGKKSVKTAGVKTAKPLTAKSYKAVFNTVMKAPTGNPTVDAVTPNYTLK